MLSRCHVNVGTYYQTQLVPGAVGDEDDRIECYKAGETIIYQIDCLNG